MFDDSNPDAAVIETTVNGLRGSTAGHRSPVHHADMGSAMNERFAGEVMSVSKWMETEDVSGCLMRRPDDDLRYSDHRITNAVSDGMNGAYGGIKAVAHGYRPGQSHPHAPPP